MGARTLKKQLELNYRRGNKLTCCGTCRQYIPDFQIHARSGELRLEPRCRTIGIDGGRAYRVLPTRVCDAHQRLAVA
jgi:hypothetical protein